MNEALMRGDMARFTMVLRSELARKTWKRQNEVAQYFGCSSRNLR